MMNRIDRAPPPPVVIERSQTVAVCPPEITAGPSDKPRVPDGAIIKANTAGHRWLDQLNEYAAALRARLLDAASACSKRSPKP
jgi:hypothetical protein